MGPINCGSFDLSLTVLQTNQRSYPLDIENGFPQQKTLQQFGLLSTAKSKKLWFAVGLELTYFCFLNAIRRQKKSAFTSRPKNYYILHFHELLVASATNLSKQNELKKSNPKIVSGESKNY